MITPAEEQALQASQMAFAGGDVPAPMVPTQPVNGEIIPQVQTSTPIAPATHSGSTFTDEGAESKAKRLQAEESARKADAADAAATLGTNAPAPPAAVSATPMAVPSGTGPFGGIPLGETLPQQKDINANVMAAVNEQNVLEKERETARINKQAQDATNQWYGEYTRLKGEATKASKITTLKEDGSFLANFGRAIAAGMGAYAAIRGGGENHAQHILDAELKQDFETKKLRLDTALDQLQKHGASQSLIEQTRDREMQRLLASQADKIAKYQAFTTASLGRFPEQQMQANAMLAKKAAETDAKAAEWAKGKGDVVRESGTATPATIQQRTDPGSGRDSMNSAKATPSTNDVVDYSTFEELDKKATRLDELTKKGEVPTPEQMDQYTNRVNQIVAQQLRETHGGTAQVILGRVGRSLDALPTSSYPDDMTPGQREWLRLHTEMGHQVAVKKFGQSAMSNPESYHEYVDPLLYGRGKTKEEGIELAGALSDQMHTTFRNLKNISKSGKQEQRIGEVETPGKATVLAPNPLEPPPALKPGETPSAPASKPSPRSGNGPIRMDTLPKDVQADLREASKIMTDTKASPKAKAAARKFTEDVARGVR